MPFLTRIEYKIGKMREQGNEILFSELRDLSKLKVYTYMIDKFKMGNCFEAAELANIAAKVINEGDRCEADIILSEEYRYHHFRLYQLPEIRCTYQV